MILDNTSLEEFRSLSGMSGRCYNCCIGLDIKTFGEFMNYTFSLNCRNMGRSTLKEITLLKTKFKNERYIKNDNIDWEQRRYDIAKTAVHGLLTGPIIDGVDPSIPDLAKWAVKIADAIIDVLKKNKM